VWELGLLKERFNVRRVWNEVFHYAEVEKLLVEEKAR
jgi:hypothetical protein